MTIKPVKVERARKRGREELILDALERLLSQQTMDQLDVAPIAAEAGITRTRFYHYFKSKNDALAALLRRMADLLRAGYEHPDGWYVGRAPGARPREVMRRTIDISTDLWWPHRCVLREASDLWSVVPAIREAWLEGLDYAKGRMTGAIERERSLGVAPPGLPAPLIAEALLWQTERIFFRAYAELPGAMSKKEVKAVTLETWMRAIFLADDPDP